MSDLRLMTLGQVVDYCIAYNERQEQTEKTQADEKKQEHRHRASQAEIDAFFG